MTTKQLQPVLNEAGTHVWLRYPPTDATWACPLDVADFYLGRGWEYSAAPGPTVEGLFDQSTAEGPNQTGFDPADHDVDEVNDHLAKYADASPGEVERVLELERAGQNRKTVVDPRPAPTDDDPASNQSDAGEPGGNTGD